MMIIILKESVLNLKVAKWIAALNERIGSYYDIDFTGINDDTLILLDLSIDGSVQDDRPDALAKHLVENGLPKSITKIIFLASDIADHPSLSSFAEQMAKTLQFKFYKTYIHCVEKFEYGNMLILPPNNKGGEWQIIYTLKKLTGIDSLETAIENTNKKLIATTNNIREWFLTPQLYVYISKAKPFPLASPFFEDRQAEKAAASIATSAALTQTMSLSSTQGAMTTNDPAVSIFVERLQSLPSQEARLHLLEDVAKKLGLVVTVSEAYMRSSSPTPGR